MYRGGEAALTSPEILCFASLLPSGILRKVASLGTTDPERTNIKAMSNMTCRRVHSMAECRVTAVVCSLQLCFYIFLLMFSMYIIIIIGDIKIHLMRCFSCFNLKTLQNTVRSIRRSISRRLIRRRYNDSAQVNCSRNTKY